MAKTKKKSSSARSKQKGSHNHTALALNASQPVTPIIASPLVDGNGKNASTALEIEGGFGLESPSNNDIAPTTLETGLLIPPISPSSMHRVDEGRF